MEKALVEDSVGLIVMRIRPGSISARSGIKKAAIKKALLKRKKKCFKKERSDICFKRANV